MSGGGDPKSWSLIRAYVDGHISEGDFEELQGTLLRDAEVRDNLMLCLTLDDELRNHSQVSALGAAWDDSPSPSSIESDIATEEPTPPTAKRQRGRAVARTRRRHLIGWEMAAAAVLLIVIGATFFTGSPSSNEPNVVAHVNRGAEIDFSDRPGIKMGDPLSPGEWKLTRGVVQIRFLSGADVNLEAPVHFRIDNQNAMTLISGRLLASVPPQAHGFQVSTDQFVAVDLGTEFGVAVEGELSDVIVFQGKVKVNQASKAELPDTEPQTLITGQGLRFKAHHISMLRSNDHTERFINSVPHRIAVADDQNLVRNHSFEIGALTRSPGKGQYRNIPTGWEHTIYSNKKKWLPARDHHGGTHLRHGDNYRPAHGERFVWINHGRFMQTMDTHLAEGVAYEVKVSVGSSHDWGDGGRHPAKNEYEIQLWAGDHILKDAKGSMPAKTKFHDVGFECKVPIGHPGLGQKLKIALVSHFKIYFDNVRVVPKTDE